MSSDDAGEPPTASPGRSPEEFDTLLAHLEELQETVDSEEEREKVRSTMDVATRIPGSGYLSERIAKYTTRDVAESFVGGILLCLPMLVEDGVFVIAEHLATAERFGVPVFLVANVAFVVVLTIGLLYWADIRQIRISNPILGIVPRRLIGVLLTSFLTALGLVFLWGRAGLGNPSDLEVFARVVVLWTAAALGAALGDILPGESEGHDITLENLEDIARRDR